MEYDNTLLYCRSCKQKVNSETKKCPQCGAEDPFYFIKVKKIKKKQIWRAILSMFIAFVITEEFIHPQSWILSTACFMGISLVLLLIFEAAAMSLLRSNIKEYSEEFKKICEDANDEVAFNVWKSKMDKIID